MLTNARKSRSAPKIGLIIASSGRFVFLSLSLSLAPLNSNAHLYFDHASERPELDLAEAASSSGPYIEIVDVADLTDRFASCNPVRHDYYHYATMTVYYNAKILCQLSLAYIHYSSKSPFS